MKEWFCPNCGEKNRVTLIPPSKIVAPCARCEKTLMVKFDLKEFVVKILKQ